MNKFLNKMNYSINYLDGATLNIEYLSNVTLPVRQRFNLWFTKTQIKIR